MGIVIFFYHYNRYTDNKIFEDFAGELLDEIFEEINSNTPINFADGLTGIGWGIEYLLQNKFVNADSDEVLTEIDDTIFRNSHYRPFLLDSGKDLFGYGLYYISRILNHGIDDENHNPIFRKQYLNFLADYCERILIQKIFLNYNIKELSIDTINSFTWFLIQMKQKGLSPHKVQSLIKSLPEYFESLLGRSFDNPEIEQMTILIEQMIPCLKDVPARDKFRNLLNNKYGRKNSNGAPEEELVNNLIKESWQRILYKSVKRTDNYSDLFNKSFEIIDNEENWIRRLNNLNKNNIGLTGFAGLGLGLLIPLMNEKSRTIQSDAGIE